MRKLLSLVLALLLATSLVGQSKIGGTGKVGGVAVNSVGTGGGGGEDLTNGLVAFWKLGEATGTTRNDSIGTNHAIDDASQVFSITGKIGNATGYDEQGSWLRAPDSVPLSITGSLTICAWVRLDSAVTLDFPGIANKWGVGQRSYSLLYDRTGGIGGTANRFIFSVSSDGTAQFHAVANTFGSPTVETWYFVVGFVDVDNDIIGISVNNGAVDTTAFTGTVLDSTADFEIGRLGTSQNILEGDVDAVGLWSRTLSATAKTCLWNSGTGQEPTFAACP